MFAVIDALLRNHLPMSFCAIVILLSAGTIMWSRHENVVQQQKVNLCRAQNQSLLLSNTALLASVKQQNMAIYVMNADAQKKIAQAENAAKRARIQSQNLAIKAKDLRNSSFDGDECQQLKLLLQHFTRK